MLQPRRFKIRFPDREALDAAGAAETTGFKIPVENEKRLYRALTLPLETSGNRDAEGSFDDHLRLLEEEYGAEVVEDFQYDLDSDDFPPVLGPDDAPDGPVSTLDDVLEAIHAEDAWQESRGEDTLIAVVDTGVDGSRPEFPMSKRAGSWTPIGDPHWTDWKGHGTMCACIAAGTKASGGVFNGVAPEAKIIACKTYFWDSELGAIYDYLIAAVDRKPDLRIVATNSFGRKTGSPPVPPANSDFVDALDEAIAKGIAVFFSAGNNHRRAGGHPSRCDPNSVWLHKSRADVMAVATCKLNDDMWSYSSRGPGQHFGDPNTNQKPDVTAPTPVNGKVVYGSGVRVLPNGWGTSGACPQAAGLAALMWSKAPGLSPAELYDHIRAGAIGIGHGLDCEGRGKIDCAATLALLP